MLCSHSVSRRICIYIYRPVPQSVYFVCSFIHSFINRTIYSPLFLCHFIYFLYALSPNMYIGNKALVFCSSLSPNTFLHVPMFCVYHSLSFVLLDSDPYLSSMFSLLRMFIRTNMPVRTVGWQGIGLTLFKHQRRYIITIRPYWKHNFITYHISLDFCESMTNSPVSFQWRHNECDGVSNIRRLDCLFNCLRIKENTKAPRHWPFYGNPAFPSQKASNGGHVSIWWRHHVFYYFQLLQYAKRTFETTISKHWSM